MGGAIGYALILTSTDTMRLRTMTDHEPRAYNVVRFYRDAGIRRRVILERLTLTEAQAHCTDPETSSSTATGKVARARTRRVGAWFDGYESR